MVGLFYACDLVVTHTAGTICGVYIPTYVLFLCNYIFFRQWSRCLGGKTTVGEYAGESCTHACVCMRFRFVKILKERPTAVLCVQLSARYVQIRQTAKI